jgi:hypothetical protein
MTQSLTGVLILILLLQAKHAICDGPLQTYRMVAAKALYGNPLGVLHSVLHGAGSLLVLAAFGLSWWLVGLLAVGEALIHYHIDYGKENLVKRRGWTVADRYFWWIMQADQTLHQFTYVAMAGLTVLLG